MSKVIFVLVISLTAFSAYTDSLTNNTAEKLEYVENLYILKTAVKDQKSLEKHLKKYSTDAQELQTGDTALHFLSDKLEEIHKALTSYSELPVAYSITGKYVTNQASNPYLEAEYGEKRDLVEYLVIQGASPYIKNKQGEKVIESQGFDLYISHILDTQTIDTNKRVYKVYLAGPEVFLPFYEQVSRFLQTQTLLFNKYRLKDSDYHIQGVFPLDESNMNSYSDYFKIGTEIYKQNRSLMNSSHAIIANMTRHRGFSMDVGTAYEIGEMVQAQKTVVGYYDEKIYHAHYKEEIVKRNLPPSSTDANHNREGLILEPLKIPDNLMVFMATLSSQEEIKIPSSSWEALFVLKAKLDSKKEP